MSRIVVSSDWHADARSQGVDRYDDVAQAVAQTVKVAKEEKVNLYLMLGDLCDPDDGPRALRSIQLAIETAVDLKEAGIDSWWLMGNHCCQEDGSGRSVLTPLAALGAGVRVFDRPASVLIPGRPKAHNGLAFAIMLPYPPATSPYDPVEFVRQECSERVALVAGHLTEISGIEPGEESLEMSRGRGVPFPLAECSTEWLLLNGHFHRGQTFTSGGRTVQIPGSICRLTHGEAKSKPRFLMVEV
jgi:DNA repair exonuclease SbcCD nuclease subunit